MNSETLNLLLTAKQAAQSLAISERTLWELTRHGEIPRLKIGASVRYDLRDLHVWIDKKKGGFGVKHQTPIEKVLTAVGEYTKSGNLYQGNCPAHQDRNASLSISAGGDGTVVVRCSSGCNAEKIVKALGLTIHDLFPSVAAQDGGDA